MEYRNYEEYMQQVLGYSSKNPNIYAPDPIYEPTYDRNEFMDQLLEDEAQEYYPEIYHSIYPIICNKCEQNNEPISKELIDRMTDEVYQEVDNNTNIINVKIEQKSENIVPQDTRRGENNFNNTTIKQSNLQRTPLRTGDTRTPIRPNEFQRTPKRQEDRPERRTNPYLRDLIKILIIQQLLRNRRPHHRINNNYYNF